MSFKVLVTGASTPAGRSMINALQNEQVTLLACDATGCGCTVDDVPPQRCFEIHEGGDPELIGDLLSLCVRHDIDVVVPIRESEQVALAEERNVFERFGTRVWLAPIPQQITRSVARRVAHFGRRRRAAEAVNEWLRRLSGERVRAC